ncbi:hypothetical protein T265_04110 [Opisthorchis viverrini]|uniref:ARID domain-containing protein n=1 Tax=Opisthorchis viverrini TaxID=6198 RepID=A0A074ZQA8_OPIVI|nr:hypothetical protein T265_04110 [Opisthorchis viverrini]KER29271.1 hypothetical protein T265_04110 [Opisthorchis viverrini]
MSQTVTRCQLPSPSLISNGPMGMSEPKSVKSVGRTTSAELDLSDTGSQNPGYRSSSSEDDLDPPAVIGQTGVYNCAKRNGMTPTLDYSIGQTDAEISYDSGEFPERNEKVSREEPIGRFQYDARGHALSDTWNSTSPKKCTSFSTAADEAEQSASLPTTSGEQAYEDTTAMGPEVDSDEHQRPKDCVSLPTTDRTVQNHKDGRNSPQNISSRGTLNESKTPVVGRDSLTSRAAHKFEFSETRTQRKPHPSGLKLGNKDREKGRECVAEEANRSQLREHRFQESTSHSPVSERSKPSKSATFQTNRQSHGILDFSGERDRKMPKADGSNGTQKPHNASGYSPYHSDSLGHLFTLDNAALAASLHSSPLLSAHSNSNRPEDADSGYMNLPTGDQSSGESGNCSNDPSMSINSCLPPMLAAAAMAALTGGRFPTGSTMGHFNPLFPQSSANLLPAHMKNYDAPMEPGCLDGIHRASGNYGSSLTGSGQANDFLSPMRAMYNTSKLLFGGGSDDRTICTPPPPSLSASASPQPAGSRGFSKSSRIVYNNHLVNEDDDCEEEQEELESMEPDHVGPEGSSSIGGQQWTFEEQFKQLYVLSDDPKRKEFLDELFAYMQRRGTPVNRIPIMAKQVLDLYELFQLVVARGGLVEVINKKLWREITKGLNLPSSITSAAFTLRTQYMKYLYPYECDTLGLSTPSELQAAIDGNRREARRSSYTFDYPMMVTPTGSNRPLTPSSLIAAHSSNSQMSSSGPMPLGSILSGSGLNGSPSFHSTMGGSGMNTGIPTLSGVTLPFGANTPIGMSSQLNPLHPLFGFPPGSTPPGLNLSSSSVHQAGAGVTTMFPTNLLPPISSTTGSSVGSGPLQSYTSGSTDPTLGSPTHSSGYLIPGIPNSFAAAAATLFGAGFPPLPGAFVAGNPHSQHNMVDSTIAGQRLNAGSNQPRHSPSSDGSHKTGLHRAQLRGKSDLAEGRKPPLRSCLLENAKRGQFSLVSVDKEQVGHRLNWSTVHTSTQERTKKQREFIEAWHSTNKAINKHIKIDPVYRPLQAKEIRDYGTQRRTNKQAIRLKKAGQLSSGVTHHNRGGEDADRDRTSSVSPLNLTATEEPMDSQSTKESSTYDDEPYSSDQNPNSPSEQQHFGQERREKIFSGDRKDEKRREALPGTQAIRRHHHLQRCAPRPHLSRSQNKEQAPLSDVKKRSDMEICSPELNGTEKEVKWMYPGCGQSGGQRSKMAFTSTNNLTPVEPEESSRFCNDMKLCYHYLVLTNDCNSCNLPAKLTSWRPRVPVNYMFYLNPNRTVLKKQTHLQISLVFTRLPDKPQEGRNRSWAVEEFSATL